MVKTSQKAEGGISAKTFTKRMHIVTEAYLSSFVDTDQSQKHSLWVFDKISKDIRLQPIKDTAVIRRFYEFELPDGTKDISLEAAFSRIESNAIPIIKRWCEKGAKPRVEELHDAAAFVTCLFVRVPRSVEFIRALASAAASVRIEALVTDEHKLRAVYAQLKEQRLIEESFTLENLKELVTHFDENFTVETSPKYALLESLRLFDVVYKNLLEMYWCLCDSRPYNGRFFTCDAPVNVFFYQDGKAGFGGGLGRPDVEVNVPLSPYVCLSINRKRNEKVRKASASFTREINRRTAYQAERYIYSSVNTKRVAHAVEEGSVTTKWPRVDVEEVKDRARRRFKTKRSKNKKRTF